MNLSEKNNHFM